ncbi:MAG: hypothetical protein KTR24_15240 [Saprospiraceae bacterium]|nr:hypothetical protein [Saprospiraceae bacterium]
MKIFTRSLGIFAIILTQHLGHGQVLFTSVPQDTIVAGTPLQWILERNDTADIQIMCMGPMGAEILEASEAGNRRVFSYQGTLTQCAGVLYWSVIGSKQEGQIVVTPGNMTSKIEIRYGPERIEAGSGEFMEVLATALDSMDNPMREGTEMIFTTQNSGNTTREQRLMEDMMARNNVYAPSVAGPMIVTGSRNQIGTREIELMITPALPAPFRISAHLIHDYADGHQLLTLESSRILDSFGNAIEDGTLVQFIISTQSDGTLIASGPTHDGKAQVALTHPEHQEAWTIQARAGNTASSNNIKLTFRAAIEDIPLHLDRSTQLLDIGPLLGPEGQWIPDGMQCYFVLRQDEKIIKDGVRSTIDGRAQVNLNLFDLRAGRYQLELRCGGMEKYLSIEIVEDE